MIVEQIYTGCLAQATYYIESKGEVAIIDPLRETKPYTDKAKQNNAKIKYIFETHFHADFVSGHLSLSKQTGAPIIYGPEANPTFKAIIAQDQQIFKLGDLSIIALHTPGHTIESTTYLLKDKNDKNCAIFTGDTLFLGDVGRPDLAQKTATLTANDLAGFLYESLQNKIMPLEDYITVYPAHCAGSACGKNMIKQTVDTLGNQKQTNYALRAGITKQEFIKEVTEGLLPPPKYFPLNVKMNKEGYEDIDTVIKRGTQALKPKDFEALANKTGAIVLDVRDQDLFAKGHIPRSIFIGLNGGFAPWVGALIANTKQPILLVTKIGQEQEAVTRLSRVGFDMVLGYLEGGFDTWIDNANPYDTISCTKANHFKNELTNTTPNIFDVRNKNEYNAEHVLQAHNTPLSDLNNHLNKLPQTKPFYLYCAGGYRSIIAASILKNRGIHNFINIEGGFKAIKEHGIKTSAWVCPNNKK